jgi:hypothetical protein
MGEQSPYKKPLDNSIFLLLMEEQKNNNSLLLPRQEERKLGEAEKKRLYPQAHLHFYCVDL